MVTMLKRWLNLAQVKAKFIFYTIFFIICEKKLIKFFVLKSIVFPERSEGYFTSSIQNYSFDQEFQCSHQQMTSNFCQQCIGINKKIW